MRFRFALSYTILAGLVLVVFALTGCERVVAERWLTWGVSDPLTEDARSIEDSEWDDRRETRPGVIWAPARIVADEETYAQRAAPLPAGSLLRVELRILPPVDCESDPKHNLFPPRELAAYPERMPPESLPALGDAALSQELWIVPARIRRGSDKPAAYHRLTIFDMLSREAGEVAARICRGSGMSGDDYCPRTSFEYDPDRDTYHDPSFNLGPFWFGTPLRQAGIGRWVYFPATQDCAEYREARGSDLPTNLFEEHKGWLRDEGYMTIRAVTPMLARVVEICPVRIEEQEEHLRVLRGPEANDLRLLIDMRRYTGKVTGMCVGGEKTFFTKPWLIKVRP